MSETASRERDLVLAPNEYAFISDQTKGNINVYVGPYKTSLANTDKPVVFDEASKRFVICSLESAIQTLVTAPEGWYVVLKNPGLDGKQPKLNTSNSLADLNIGRKVNIPGPVFFALWPGQMARVIPGHHLHSNQYLLVRVYDEEEARQNWAKGVIRPKGEETALDEVPEIRLGQTLVIPGNQVAFYIPPTGVEVVRDESRQYVREAVTLERMEYCILLDEDGNKRFVKGPAVVFPKPSEEFVARNGFRKFRALELDENSGLYIKVIAPYSEDGKNYQEGEELFITGSDQMIYYPRPEHAIIKYGGHEKHFGIAIPPGEGRYYLNRKTGEIKLMCGPTIFLPDPRLYVIVRRVLDPGKVQLWFPGNTEALQYNQRLKELLARQKGQDYVSDEQLRSIAPKTAPAPSPGRAAQPVSAEVAAESMERGEKYTPPRTITLDSKYEGAVTLNLWNGYAVLVTSKTGTRKVLLGPTTHLLEYDEDLQTLELSTGTPKTEDRLQRTVYLRVMHNKISDVVAAESADYCQVNLQLSYRMNFTGEPESWFAVENYVKFLCDHLRSLLRNLVKKYPIMEFYAQATDLVRDTILGKPDADGKRTGRTFAENGMQIYDVEVLDVRLGDTAIEQMLVGTQHDVVKQKLELATESRRLEYTRQREEIQRQTAQNQSETRQQLAELQQAELVKTQALHLARQAAELEARQQKLTGELAQQKAVTSLHEGELARQKKASEQELEFRLRDNELNMQLLRAEVEAVVNKAQAISPGLIEALQAFSNRELAGKMAETMAPLAILGGKSVAEVLARLLQGTAVAQHLDAFGGQMLSTQD